MASPPVREIEGGSIVAVGRFNPAIFQPMWFAHMKLIPQSEAEAAEIQIVNPSITRFSTDIFDLQITQEQFQISTARAPSLDMASDLFVGTFNILRHTPIAFVGLNRDVHFRMASREDCDAVGYRFSPRENWVKMLNKPGLRTLVQQGERTDGHKGWILVKLEPSVKIEPGIFVQVNDHFELENRDSALDAVEIVQNEWTSARERAETVLKNIFEESQ